MAVVIRLQGLRVTAGTQDIRKFFTGLKIPDGGVHIIGGDREEAFIIFASDEDARRAMTRSGGVIKGGNITLLLSSKSEMQSMLEKSTKSLELDQQRQLEEDARRTHRSVEAEVNRRAGNRLEHTPAPRHQWASHPNDELLVFLKGLPFSVTEKEIQEFFDGLLVDDMVLLRNERGQNNGTGLVKFSTSKDAKAGLERDRNYIGSRYVEVYTTTQDNWRRLAGRPPHGANTDGVLERGGSPFRGQRNFQHQVRPRAPLSQRPTPSLGEEFCILLENLSFAVEKEDIRKFFRSASLEDDQILLLRGDFSKRTRSAFVLFKTMRDYRDATVTEKRSFFNRWIHIRPVSREKMISILDSEDADAHTSGNAGNLQEGPPSHLRDNFESEKVCLFVQNLPFDVRKVEIMDFFFGFNITENNVFLLRNNAGAGIGKALVLFRSESAAMSALSLSGQRFLGSEVALKCISRTQMQEMGVEPPMMDQPHLRENRFPGRGNEAGCEGNMPMTNMQSRFHGGQDQGSYTGNQYDSQDRGNGIRGSYGPSGQPFEGPTCIKLVNLPFQIKSEEIYDFCYGYRIIPGSVSLQYDKSGAPQGSATVVFESRQEALTAVEELSGRPIGPRKVQLLFV